jgi:hypothetical protein
MEDTMNQEHFNAYANSLMSQASKVRNAKRTEYEAEHDCLSNFRKAADLQNTTVPVAIAGMMSKHTVSIYDMIKVEFDIAHVDPPYSLDIWREKLIDHINYLLILYASIREFRGE